MDEATLVSPPLVASPLRLLPFHAISLDTGRTGGRTVARALARPYRSVTDRLRSWERRGRLLRDPEPAVYVHEYTTSGITVRGVVGAMDLSRRAADDGARAVLPHEGVHTDQARELAERMYEMQVNPAPILMVHRARPATRAAVYRAMAAEPWQTFEDHDHQRHRIWAVRDPEALAQLQQSLSDTRAVIADGHHRYDAYLRLQESHPGTAWDRGLAMLVDQDDTPLFLGAIHRLLRGTSMDDVRRAVETSRGLVWSEVGETDAVAALGPGALVATDGRRWAVATFTGASVEAPTCRAAVEVLHHDIVPRLDPAPTSTEYGHRVDVVLRRAEPGRAVAVLLPAPGFDVVHRIVAEQGLLPEKATSFQPKPTTGVIMRSVADG
ncbi:DUF1015 family protein [Nocardioides lentus]|uniref:DUF1015 family protein n=1 Tax=Nocardioides lentus TaxID=338077 RepID=UPI0031D0C4BA